MSRHTRAVSAALCAVFAVSACGAPSTSAPTKLTDPSVATQPEDKGESIAQLIAAAQQTIDIVIYQIGNPDIEKQLIAAMARGVKVRVILDGDASNQPKARAFVQRMRTMMREQRIAFDQFEPHWSNNNFSLTHQKSILIDASASGINYPAKLLISTGNLLDTGYGPYFTARDIYLTTSQPEQVQAAAHIFESDFTCASRTTTNGLAGAAPPLLWSNGTTGMYAQSPANPVGSYPGRLEGYYAKLIPGPRNDQGNVTGQLLELIASARSNSVIRVYGEELSSQTFIDALVRAATPTTRGGQGADVRIVMSYRPVTRSDQSVLAVKKVVAAGGRANLMADQSDVRDALYIHAKMITVTNPDGLASGFVGSQNLTDPSLTFNRELGYLLTASDAEALASLSRTFDADFNRTDGATKLTPTNPDNVPSQWRRGVLKPVDDAPTLSHPRAACGPVD